MKCPCIECEMQGCGKFHDLCEPYQAYAKDKKDDREDIRKRYSFTIERKRRRKGSHFFEHQKNISY